MTRDKDGNLRPSIIDPHGAHLADTLSKLKALAAYTDAHGDESDRVVAVGIEKDGFLYGINLKDPKVRQRVYECSADAGSVKALFGKHRTKYTEILESD